MFQDRSVTATTSRVMIHDARRKVISAVIAGLLVCAYGARAEAQAPPVVVQKLASTAPPPPPTMKLVCVKGPNSFEDSPFCPVVQFGGYTFWAFSYFDNRVSMGIVQYDPAGKLVAQWEARGARYLYAITTDDAAHTVTLHGQADQTVTLTWTELAPVPVVLQRPADPVNPSPKPPQDMDVVCVTGPDSFVESPTCPVIQWHGVHYWPFSYLDNRLSMGIVAYDRADQIVAQWEKPGARYVYAITIDPRSQTVTFYGQTNDAVTMTWAELGSPP